MNLQVDRKSNKPTLLNNKVCILYENIDTHSVFETDEGCYVWDKVKDQIITLSLDSFNDLLIKLATVTPNENENKMSLHRRFFQT